MKKRIVVLGSTGSIGRQVLEVVRAMPGKFEILALCAGSDAGLLRQQALEFRPQWLGLADPEEAADLAGLGARVEAGPEAASLLAALPVGAHRLTDSACISNNVIIPLTKVVLPSLHKGS